MTMTLKAAAMAGDNSQCQENIQTGKVVRSLTSMRLSDFEGAQFQPELSLGGDKARCERCKEFNLAVTVLCNGKIIASKICNECRTALEAEEGQRRLAYRQAHIEDLLAGREVPKRFLQCTLDNYEGYERLKVKVRPTLITGPVGTGKTHLAVAYLGEALVQHGEHHGRFLEAVKLFLDLRDTFSKDSRLDESGILERYLEVPLLVLDDLGAEKVSDYVKQTLYLLINKRYGDCRDTIITSNLSLDEIGQNYGDRLASRIAGMGGELVLKGKDRRLG